MNGGESSDEGTRSTSRRQFVKAAGATGATASLAGCTSLHPIAVGGGDEAPNTVQWAADQIIADASEEIEQALHEAGLPQHISLEIIRGGQGGARQAQYTRWLSANLSEPDLLMMDSGWTIPFIAREQVLSLEEVLPKSMVRRVKNDYFQASVGTVTNADDKLYGIPLFPDFPTMQYRKDLVKKAGYDPEGQNWATESMNWKRFAKITKEVKESNDLPYGFTFQADVYEGLSCCDFNEFMSGWGGAYFGDLDNLFGPIGERPVTVAEKPVVNSMRMIRSFIQGPDNKHALDDMPGPISPRAVLQWTEEPSRKPFTSGNAVMHRNWPYSIIISGAEDALGKDLGVMPIPYGVPPGKAKYKGTGGPVAALGGWHLTVNPNTEKLDQTVQVLKAMMKRSFKIRLFEVAGLLPPEPKILESEAAKKVDIIGRYIDAIRVAGENAVPRPVTAVWPLESTKIAQSVHAGYSGARSPQAALQTLKEDLTMVENYNENP